MYGEILYPQSELGEHFFHRGTLFTSGQCSFSFDNTAAIFLCDRLVIRGSSGRRTGNGVEQEELEEAHGRLNLVRRQPLEQRLGMLLVG